MEGVAYSDSKRGELKERVEARPLTSEGNGKSMSKHEISLSQVFFKAWYHFHQNSPTVPVPTNPSQQRASLDQALAGLLSHAHSAWPTIELSDEVFLSFVAERVDESQELPTAIGKLHGADLYLACACLRGEDGALEGLSASYRSLCEEVINRFGLTNDRGRQLVDEANDLLVKPREGQQAPLALYRGRSELAYYLRLTFTREALTLLDERATDEFLTDTTKDVESLGGETLPFSSKRDKKEFLTAITKAGGSFAGETLPFAGAASRSTGGEQRAHPVSPIPVAPWPDKPPSEPPPNTRQLSLAAPGEVVPPEPLRDPITEQPSEPEQPSKPCPPRQLCDSAESPEQGGNGHASVTRANTTPDSTEHTDQTDRNNLAPGEEPPTDAAALSTREEATKRPAKRGTTTNRVALGEALRALGASKADVEATVAALAPPPAPPLKGKRSEQS